MMPLKLDNLRRFEQAYLRNDRAEITAALMHDFGGKDGARTVLAYLSSIARVHRVESRMRIVAAAAVGVLAGAGIASAVLLLIK